MIGRLTNKGISEIVKSINGRIRNMLCSHLDYMSYFEDVIKETKSQIDKVLLPTWVLICPSLKLTKHLAI